jgi:hypothetical protein
LTGLGQEILGIPILLLIIVGVGVVLSALEERKKRLKPWHKISTDLSPEEVRAILGAPDQVSRTAQQEVWTYGVGPAAGCVTFEKGKVVGYKKPPGA